MSKPVRYLNTGALALGRKVDVGGDIPAGIAHG